ncbi:MAG TPA: helix-turn-helix domain-containing protein [Candidatus Acidoferrales bacterium]|nr:helix-turn-helix domain-containing protein [Candidatus Acidoferrales bacterium]
MKRNLHTKNRSFPPRPAGRRERRRAETRERLYRAALHLFATRGFLKTTVEDITEAADVGKGTFFNYFPTKEHVLAAFGGERIAAVQQALDRARSTRGSVLAVLKDLATDAAGQSKENPALLRAIYAAHASCAAVREELESRLIIGRGLLAEIFAVARQRGEVRAGLSTAEMARLTQTIFLGVTMAWAMNPVASLRQTAGGVWDLLSPGLRASGPHAARPRPARAGNRPRNKRTIVRRTVES